MTGARYDYWTDCDRTPVPHSCRIEQVGVAQGFGALRFRLHRQGQVMGRGTTRLLVRFDGEDAVVGIRPHLVRVLTEGPS